MQKLGRFVSLFTFLLLLFSVSSYAQEKTVRGVVKDSRGETLIGVSVKVKDSSVASITGIDGDFSLSAPQSATTLLVSYIGMITKEVQIVVGTKMEIVLEDDTESLEEVIVIGYGSVRKKDLTGAVSSVDENILKNIPITSTASAITGRLAGVSVVTTQGSPDATVNIRVRGGGSISQDNSPLYIIDGFQASNIDDVPPGDIESINVLKDASSTAIYGAKGANGVILITTKSGKAGKTSISLNTSVGFNNMYNETAVLSPYEYVYLQRELDTGTGFSEKYGRWEDVDIYKSRRGDNWQDKLFSKTGVKQSYNLSLRGGDESLIYSISYTRDDESYIMKTSNNKRDNLNIKIDKTISKNLKLEFNPKMTYRVIDGTSVSNGRKLRDCVKFPSVGTLTSLTLDDLEDGYNLENISNLNDPFYNVANEYKKQTKFSNSYNLALNWTIIKGLKLRAYGTYGFRFDRTDQIYLKNTGEANGKAGQPVAYRTYWTGNNWAAGSTLTYNKDINDHHFDAMAGFEMNHLQADNMKINSDYYPHDYSAENILAFWNNGTAEPTYTTIDEADRTSSYFGRANYVFKNRYYLTATLRTDGINVFAPGKKWGVFPGGAAAWRVSEEHFMEGTRKWLSNLKIRASYGSAGNARIKSYWRTTYTPETSTKNLYYINEIGQSALKPSDVLRNENLSWETKYSTNLGLDFGLFQNRLDVTLEFYKDVTKDLLMRVDIPSNSGFKYQYQNLGQTSNRGLELTLNGSLVSKNDFYLNVNFNIAFNKNRVDALYGTHNDEMYISGGGAEIGSDNYRVRVGEPVGLIWGYVSDGMYSFDDFLFDDATKKWVLDTSKEDYVDASGVLSRAGNYYGPGHMKLKDLNGDNKIDADNDRRIIGNALPKHTGGFSVMTGWKGFDLIAMFNWSYGNDVLNASKIDYTSYAGSKRYQNMTTEMSLANRFTTIDPETGKNIYHGTDANPNLLQRLNANANIWHPMTNATVMTDWAVEDGSYLRLGNMTLGYTFPKQITRKFGVQNLRLYGTATNIFCLTSYSGQDPEVNTSDNNLSPGMDDSAYPKSKSYIFGLNITF